MSSDSSRRLAAWLAGIWAGVMAGLGFVSAPTLFAVLARDDAGRAASRLFAHDAFIGLAFGMLLLVITMQRAGLDAEAGRGGSRFSTDMILVLAALFCVVAGHFGVQPMIESARRGVTGPSVAVLHGTASAFFVVKFLLVALLAWRLTSARAGSNDRAARAAVPTS